MNEQTISSEWRTRWMASTFAKLAEWRWEVRCWKPQKAQHQTKFSKVEYMRRTATQNSNIYGYQKNVHETNRNNLSAKTKTRTKQNNDWLAFGEAATAMQHATA